MKEYKFLKSHLNKQKYIASLSLGLNFDLLLAMIQDYFPKIHEAQGYPITIQDTIGKDWKLEFHCLEKSNSEEKYVLEGLTDYMVLMQWQAGDKGILYNCPTKSGNPIY